VNLEPVEILQELVAIPSVNPMGGDSAGAEFGEGKLTDFLQCLLEGIGLPCHRQTVHPQRENLIARLDGDLSLERGGKSLLFGVHQDTVPVAGMTIPPWNPEVKGARLYGRGACDVKGGMAAMLAAVARLASERPQGMPTVLIVFTVNEEYGFSGASALVELCQGRKGPIIPRTPDAAVIAEPTGLDVVVAHKGVVRWRCHALGRAGHSADPNAGDNAIYKMGRALSALERYHKEVLPTWGSHPLCGPATMSVGTIRGGVSVNTIPSRCTIEIDRRFPPGEGAEHAYRHLVDHLREDADMGTSLEHEPPYMVGNSLSDHANGPLADRLAETVTEVRGKCLRQGVPYATDAAFFADAGIPTVVFGPGSIEQAHTEDEWIALDQLEQATEIYYRFAAAGAF
jgi:acetylornithine deacetylase